MIQDAGIKALARKWHFSLRNWMHPPFPFAQSNAPFAQRNLSIQKKPFIFALSNALNSTQKNKIFIKSKNQCS
jgi:hypothetical protein